MRNIKIHKIQFGGYFMSLYAVYYMHKHLMAIKNFIVCPYTVWTNYKIFYGIRYWKKVNDFNLRKHLLNIARFAWRPVTSLQLLILYGSGNDHKINSM